MNELKKDTWHGLEQTPRKRQRHMRCHGSSYDGRGPRSRRNVDSEVYDLHATARDEKKGLTNQPKPLGK